MSELTSQPHDSAQGDLVIRVVAMPADTNAHGDIFGGWILSQMDLGGAIAARKTAQTRVVTVAIKQMSFLNPVVVGDVVSFYAKTEKVGTTSIQIRLEAWVHRSLTKQNLQVTHGLFTYVAINEQGKPVSIK